MRHRPVAASARKSGCAAAEPKATAGACDEDRLLAAPRAARTRSRTCFVGGVRCPHARQFAGPMQPRQRNRISPVRFDPLARPFRDQSRSDHHAFVAERLDLPIKLISRRFGFKPDMRPAVSTSRSLLDRSLDRQQAVLDVAEKPDFSRPGPPSAIATACFFLATSKATKTSLTFPWPALRALRLGSACLEQPRSYLYERAGHHGAGPRT